MRRKNHERGRLGVFTDWVPAALAAAGLGLLFLAGLGGCAGGPGIDPDPEPSADRARAVNGVAGKPIVATARGPVIADELVLKFQPGVDQATALDLATSLGAELSWFSPRTGSAVLRFADDAALRVGALRASQQPAVAWAVRSYVASATGISTSPGPMQLQWNLEAMKLSTERGWGTASGVRVAILDSGVAYEDHSDLTGDYALAPDLAGVAFSAGYDFINDDAHPNDDQGHGTHLAGVIAASEGVAPIAPGAEILPVKVLDSSNRGTELALAEGIYYAVDNGADVINMSLAFPPTYYPSPLLQAAIDYADASGVVLVAASGNHGADQVAYPAAFRAVIAVGASELESGVAASSANAWASAHAHLAPAAYANAGFALDLAAPAGRIGSDIDGDGYPEAILAQTFDGNPDEFDYFFYAGTSQAAAQVSGIVAVMLAQNRDLDGDQLRNLLGTTARHGAQDPLLDAAVGRGYLQAGLASKLAGEPPAARDRLQSFAAVVVRIRRDGAGHRYCEAVVEVADERGEPIKNATVYGSFSGNASGPAVGRTDLNGTVSFRSAVLHGDQVIAGFQVDAVTAGGAVDRPRGFLRIDSCSLEILAEFAMGSGISTSPGPITLRLADPASSSSDTVQTVMLMNYAFHGAVAPMAVAIDETWYQGAFTDGELSTVEAYGAGISTSPIIIDPQRSFHPLVTQSWQPDASSAACVDLVLRTFSAGPTDSEFSPLILDPLSCQSRSCGGADEVLLELWQSALYGISTSPVWDPPAWMGSSLVAHLQEMVDAYSAFGARAQSFPVSALGGVLDAAGIGLAPLGAPSSNSGTGIEAMNH